jgi:hypothetical protein
MGEGEGERGKRGYLMGNKNKIKKILQKERRSLWSGYICFK